VDIKSRFRFVEIRFNLFEIINKFCKIVNIKVLGVFEHIQDLIQIFGFLAIGNKVLLASC